MRVDTDFRCRIHCLTHRVDPLGDVTHRHRTTGVDDVDASRAVALHEFGLLRQNGRRGHVAHHQEADGVHAEIPCGGDVCGRGVGLRAVGGYAHYRRARVVSVFEVVHGANARQHKRRDLRAVHGAGGGFDPLHIRMRAEAVDTTGPGKTVAVRDFD